METVISPMAFLLLLLRLMAGILFFFQGYDKVFKLGLKNVHNTVAPSYREIKMPEFMIRLMVFFTSYAELIGGFLLLTGLFRLPAIYLLGIDLLVAAAGMSLVNPVWDSKHIFIRLVLIASLLLLPLDTDVFCLDAILLR